MRGAQGAVPALNTSNDGPVAVGVGPAVAVTALCTGPGQRRLQIGHLHGLDLGPDHVDKIGGPLVFVIVQVAAFGPHHVLLDYLNQHVLSRETLVGVLGAFGPPVSR